MSITELLDAVLPYPKKCCAQRQIALKRMQFTNWINRHRNLPDAEIIEQLKKDVMKETDQDYGGFVAWFIILPVCIIASLFRKIFR